MRASHSAVTRSREEAAMRGELPMPERIDERTWCLPLPIDFPNGSVRFTLCYVLEDAERGIHLIDPGADSEDNVRILTDFLTDIGRDRGSVRSCIVTHLHLDHLGMAHRLRDHGAATVMGAREARQLKENVAFPDEGALARWGVPDKSRGELRARVSQSSMRAADIHVDVRVEEGDVLPIPGREVVVVDTPGHTAGHVCLVEEGSGLFFSGDHVLPIVNPGIGHWVGDGENPLDCYLDSLRKTVRYDHLVVSPGHGYRFTGLAERSAQIAEHHEARTRAVARAMRDRPADSVWGTAQRIPWTAGLSTLVGPRLVAALAQTEMHMTRVRAGSH